MINSANVTIMVADMDAAVKFYAETLGLKLGMRFGNDWAQIDAPGLTIGLHPAKTESSRAPSRALSLGLNVLDLDAARQKLAAAGVKFEGEVKDGEVGRFIYFKDPDGTPLYLMEMKKGW